MSIEDLKDKKTCIKEELIRLQNKLFAIDIIATDIVKINKEIDQKEKELEAKIVQIDQETKEESLSLQNTIENPLQTHALIKGTTMHTSLLEHFENDNTKVEAFAHKLDAPVRAYLKQELEGFPAIVIDSMSTGIQFSMMEVLATEGQEKMDGLFDSFSKMNTDGEKKSIRSGFQKMFSFFRGSQSFLDLARRVDGITKHIRDNKNILIQNNIPISTVLSNPYMFKQLLTSGDIQSDYSKHREEKFTEDKNTIPENREIQLTDVANDEKLKLTPKMIKSLSKASDTALKFMNSRGKIKNTLLPMLASGDKLLNRGIPGMFTIGGVLGIEKGGSLIDMIDENTRYGKIIDFILRIFGFGGIEGARKEIVNYQLEGVDSPERKAFIGEAFKYYDSNLDGEITDNTFDKVSKLGHLKKESIIEIDQARKDKIPQNYGLLADSIKKSLEDKLGALNPDVLRKYGIAKFVDIEKYIETKTVTKKDKNGVGKQVEEQVEIETVSSIKDTDKLIDGYLQKAILELAGRDKFMNKIENSHDFSYALFGNLVLDSYFVKGVELGLEKTKTPETNSSQNKTPEDGTGETNSYEPIDFTNLTVSNEVFYNSIISKESLNSEQQGNFKTILKEIETQEITDPNQIAYIISTVKTESGFKNTKEIGEGEGKKYSIVDYNTLNRYYGRGFVQLTWKENYEKLKKIIQKDDRFENIDIVNYPDNILNNTELSAFILVYGMKYGSFTGKKLSDYWISPTDSFDYKGARAIINGEEKNNNATKIADDTYGYLQAVYENTTTQTNTLTTNLG